MSPSLQQAHHHPPGGSPFQHHYSPSIRPNIRLRWQRNRRMLGPAAECHWSDTEEDILVVQGDWNEKVVRDACGNWQCICGPLCNDDTNERRLRLLQFATFNDLVLANTFGHHKASRRWTWHSPNGQHHNQIDYILVMTRFRKWVNSARTQSFPGADIGSDHVLLMMTFRLRLKKKKSASQNTQDSSLTSKSWKIPTCWKPSKLW